MLLGEAGVPSPRSFLQFKFTLTGKLFNYTILLVYINGLQHNKREKSLDMRRYTRSKRWTNLLAIAVLFVLVAVPVRAEKMPTNGLVLWLKADAITGKTNGQAISAWNNSSRVAYTATATSGQEPSYISSNAAFAGQPGVRFDGVNDAFAITNFAMPAPDLMVFVVGEFSGSHGFFMEQSPNSLVSPGFFVAFGGSAGGTQGNVLRTALTGMGRFGDFGIQDLSAPVFMAFQYKASADAWSAWTNGVPLPAPPYSWYGNGSVPNPLTGGATNTLKIMRFEYNNTYRAGDVAEVLIYTAALSQADRQLAEGLLAWKYGMQANLPADHPWKNVNPGKPPGTLFVVK
jgi:hypothetical protein